MGCSDYESAVDKVIENSLPELCGDIQLAAYNLGRDRSLWLLSDKSRCAARLSLDTPLRPSHSKIRHFQEIWRLPKHTKKPEGIAAIDEDHILVAMDTKSMLDNGVIVSRSRR